MNYFLCNNVLRTNVIGLLASMQVVDSQILTAYRDKIRILEETLQVELDREIQARQVIETQRDKEESNVLAIDPELYGLQAHGQTVKTIEQLEYVLARILFDIGTLELALQKIKLDLCIIEKYILEPGSETLNLFESKYRCVLLSTASDTYLS